jgi:hypothetical protein
VEHSTPTYEKRPASVAAPGAVKGPPAGRPFCWGGERRGPETAKEVVREMGCTREDAVVN